MTHLLLSARIGQLALAALAAAAILVSFVSPAVTEAAGGAQAAGSSEDFVFVLLALAFGAIVAGVTTSADAIAGLVAQAGL